MSDNVPTQSEPLADCVPLFSALSEAVYRAEKGAARAALTDALEEYLEGGWQAYPEEVHRLLDGYPADVRSRIQRSVSRVLSGVQRIWSHVPLTEDGMERAFAEFAPAIAALILNSVLASRFLEHPEEEVDLERTVLMHMLRVAGWVHQVRASMERESVDMDAAMPAVLAAAGRRADGRLEADPPSTVDVGTEKIDLATSEDFFRSIVRGEAADPSALFGLIDDVYDRVSVLYDLPDIGTAATFESRTMESDRKAAIERLIDNVFRAERERSGKASDHFIERLIGLETRLLPVLERIAHYTKWGKSLNTTYEGAWAFIEKEAEFLARSERSDDPVPIDIPDVFDGLTAFGLYLQDRVRTGESLGHAWLYLTEWGEAPRDGGFRLSSRAQNELANLTLYNALGYAATFASEEDPYVGEVVERTGRSFARERLHELEIELRRNGHLDNGALKQLAEERLEVLAERGGIARAGMDALRGAVDRMIDRIRAHQEVLRLLTHRAVADRLPTDVLNDLERLPHSRRQSEIRYRTPLWMAESRSHKTYLNFLHEVKQRLRAYLPGGGERLDPEPYDKPTDRWDPETARRHGRWRSPHFRTIATAPDRREGAEGTRDVRTLGFQRYAPK